MARGTSRSTKKIIEPMNFMNYKDPCRKEHLLLVKVAHNSNLQKISTNLELKISLVELKLSKNTKKLSKSAR
jgi:hypothetical protein